MLGAMYYTVKIAYCTRGSKGKHNRFGENKEAMKIFMNNSLLRSEGCTGRL
jgi:hypothetical protein